MSDLLKVENISKRYQQQQVVDALSLQLQQGEIVGILGPNGAGKTTAFYMISGLIRPDTGRVMLNDTDMSDWPMHQRAQNGIGYLPQESSIFQKLSVEDNIRVALETLTHIDRQQYEEILEKMLRDFHLQGVRKQLGESLSGGERRRTEIARLLTIQPRFLLLDEPFAGIDPISISELQKLTQDLKQQNFGLLISDHNVQATLHICDRAYIVHQGKVIAEGTPEKILADETVKTVYLGDDFQL